MRTTQTRKRSRPNIPITRYAKRRRYQRRYRRAGKTSSLSTRSLGASNAFAFRGRKLRKGAWRRHILADTLSNTHFRSINAGLTTLTTPAAVTDCNATRISVLSTSSPFWKSISAINQGLQGSDLSGTGVVTIPTWGVVGNTDPNRIVIRGGRFWITANCQSNDDPCNVRIQLAFAKQNALSVAGAASNTLISWFNTVDALTPKPLSWTYQQQADYDEFMYKPILDKTYRLRPGDDITIVKKIKPMVIDTAVFLKGGGWFPYWLVYCSQSATNIAGTPVVGFVTGSNMSFSVTQENT